MKTSFGSFKGEVRKTYRETLRLGTRKCAPVNKQYRWQMRVVKSPTR